MGNVNDFRNGQRVISLAAKRNRLPADFPGWGKPGDIESLIPFTAGLMGTVTYVESHGSNPWTRYCVRFDDGSSASGCVPQQDFEFICTGSGRPWGSGTGAPICPSCHRGPASLGTRRPVRRNAKWTGKVPQHTEITRSGVAR